MRCFVRRFTQPSEREQASQFWRWQSLTNGQKHMRVALTGTSSTGKTTLAQALRIEPALGNLVFVGSISRELLREMGCRSMDVMTRQEMRDFQLAYLDRKLALESDLDSYITERSTVDVAAYWIVRDAFDLPKSQRDGYLRICREHAKRYDVHFYLPFGLIGFEFDGYRSENIEFHKQIDEQIRTFLDGWKLRYVVLDVLSLNERVARVIKHIVSDKS
jgi:nicotinamide riboside kinase